MNGIHKHLAAILQSAGRLAAQPRAFRRLCADVRRALAANRPAEAMQILGPFLGYPGEPEHDDPAMWRAAMELFAQIMEAMGIDAGLVLSAADADPAERSAAQQNALAHLIRSCGENPQDAETLHLLANVMPSIHAVGIGAMMLARATRLAPDNGVILADLGFMLLDMRLYRQTVRTLSRHVDDPDSPPRLRYALVWAYLHQGKLDDARQQWQLVRPPAEEADKRPYNTVDGILRRCIAYNQVARLSPGDLRGWNFAFNGSILLHCARVGVEVMHGRYSVLYDRESHCLEGIRRLAAVLAACGLSVPRLFAPAEHDSQVLATATARYLQCDLMPWPDGGTTEPGLIVIYDAEQISPDVLSTMAAHHPQQFLWVHALSWIEDIPVGPDFITHLYEMNVSPWIERPLELAHIPQRQTGSVAELADRILNAPLPDDALADLPELCRWIEALPTLPQEHAAGALRNQGTRHFFFADSPVPSNSFRYMDHPEQPIDEEQLRGMASDLTRSGLAQHEVEERLIAAGAEPSDARAASTLAAVSHLSQRSDALNSHLQKGMIGLLGGLVVGALAYSSVPFFFTIAGVALLYGLYHLASGLLMQSSRSMSSEDGQRVVTCVVLLAVGSWMVFIAERGASQLSGDMVYRVAYWALLIGGYALALLGIWGLLDKSAMRLRTGDPARDALSEGEVGKLGRFLLVAALVIAGHVAIKRVLFNASQAPSSPAGFVSPLDAPSSPLAPDQ